MAANLSAGLLMFTIKNGELKVFLVHPGGPFFEKRDKGYWGIPKGLQDENEDLLKTAVREFEEETGIKPEGDYIPLGSVKQKTGKIVHAWGFKCEDDSQIEIKCNTFEIEWPPNSEKMLSFPEVDKGEFFTVGEAKEKIIEAQKEFITRLEAHLKSET
jgi:predicted NUDIX family NTP pyrophosphohydrolase